MKYQLNICPVCEKPIISRNQTDAERKEYQKQFEGMRSVSVFESIAKVVVKSKCSCNQPLEYAVGLDISTGNAKRLMKKMEAIFY